jgi:hypothetical protein
VTAVRVGLVACAVAACTRSVEPRPDPAPETASLAPDASAATPPTPAPAPTRSAAPPSVPTASPGADAGDVSRSSCRVLRGPIELPVRGPAALVPTADGLEAVLNLDGRPLIIAFPAAPWPGSGALAAVSVEALDAGAPVRAGGATVPCTAAGPYLFCPDRSGAVHRTSAAGEGDRIVASGRARTRVAAATVGGAHAALAYLASRLTSEGWVSEAWLAVDDDVALRLSEDGSGATAVTLAPRGTSFLALIVDARAALTAMHVRPVAYDHGARLGEDVVVFVGGPGDRRTGAALAAPATGPSLALLPIARDMADFGLALVAVEDPPQVDEPVAWSMYANGLDPAPVAATFGAGRAWVARVRPQSAVPRAPQTLELGEVDDLNMKKATFRARTAIAVTSAASDVDLALDAQGAVWVTWLDASGTWLERVWCK